MKPENIKIKHWWLYNIFFFFEHILGYKLFQFFFKKSKNKLYNNIDSYLSKNPLPNRILVGEVDVSISKNEFLEICYKSNLPKIFKGAAKDWNVVNNWSLDFFEEKHGEKEIIITDNVGVSDQEFEKMSLKEYISQIKQGTHKYLRFSDLVNEDEGLKNDFGLDWLRKYKIPYSWGEDFKMFIGRKDSVTGLHVGISSFLFVQAVGRKKWILYPTNNRIFLDPRTERTFHYYSRANPYNIDDENFPLLKYAQKYEVILEPGDVLWVPTFMWHHVENLDESIGIRYGHTSVFASLKSSKMLSFLILLATNPSIFTHFYTARTKNKEIQFLKSQKS